MISKNEIKYIQTLYQKKHRTAERLFIAEGRKLVGDLLQSSFKVQQLYALASWQPPVQRELPITIIDDATLQKISSVDTPQQVVGIFHLPQGMPLPPPNTKPIIILDNIQDPGNLGTIIRTADWFGFEHIVASEHTVDCFNPKTIQATMGSIARVQVHYTSLATYLPLWKVVYGALLNGVNMYDWQPEQAAAIVIGNEGKGISDTLHRWVSQAVTIPKFGGAESLNAAMAAGIILARYKQVWP
ncbi:MAG TPA: RNA methyltransferase [Chitinophagaceae bacterium]|nr:RNA methyltransferase [Chitinophagaceae bacterium]HAN38156.1 RNA methyltransferase [Chitinophagaceae bacterium]